MGWQTRCRTRYDSTAGLETGSIAQPETNVTRQFLYSCIAVPLMLASAEPAHAQYRRQMEELEPMLGVSISAGALLSYDETVRPIETPPLDEDRSTTRSIGTTPWLSASARYGRGLALYANAGVGIGGEAELSGTDPLTGEVVDGTDDLGVMWMISAGASFAPLREAMGLRLEVGPAWIDTGSGGSYLAARISASAKFVEIGDSGGILIGWDGYFAGGQHDRDAVEFQLVEGMISGVRLGFELTR